jgi:hypothetical protein
MKNNKSIFGKVFALVVAVGFVFTFIPLLGFTPWQDPTRRSLTELSSLSSAMTQPSRTLTVKEAYVLAQKEAQRWHGEAKLYDLISTDARDNSLSLWISLMDREDAGPIGMFLLWRTPHTQSVNEETEESDGKPLPSPVSLGVSAV